MTWSPPDKGARNRTSNGEPLAFLFNVVENCKDECIAWPFATDGRGYGQLHYDGRTFRAHRLALMLFSKCEDPGPKISARHLCGSGRSGCINPRHIAWGTHKDNSDDMIRHGRTTRGQRNASAKLTDDQVLEILDHIRRGEKQKDVAEIFNVSRSLISAIANGNKWSWLGAAVPRAQLTQQRVRNLPRGMQHPMAKLNQVDADRIRARALAGEPHENIARDFGVSRSTVGHIKTRRKWAHVTNPLEIQADVESADDQG